MKLPNIEEKKILVILRNARIDKYAEITFTQSCVFFYDYNLKNRLLGSMNACCNRGRKTPIVISFTKKKNVNQPSEHV